MGWNTDDIQDYARIGLALGLLLVIWGIIAAMRGC